MKQPNKSVTKAVAGLVAVGTLAPSCNNDFLYVNQSEESENGISAININLSKAERDYLIFLDKLGKDIINSPIIAQEFAKNPQLFVEKYGYYEKVDIEENMLKLILTLGDEEINAAVKAGDINLVLILMKEKNLLDVNYSNLTLSEEQYKEIFALLGIDDEVDFDQYACTLGVFACVVLLFVGAISMAAVGWTAAGVIQVGVVLAYATKTNAGGSVTKNFDYVHHYANTNFLEHNTPLTIWGLKGDSKNTYIAANMYIEEQVNQLLETLEKIDNRAFDKIPKEQLAQILKLNIINQ